MFEREIDVIKGIVVSSCNQLVSCVCVGPHLDWDPDIVAGLDVDFDYDNPDNILEDDFVAIAEGPVPQAVDDDMEQEIE